MSNSDQGSFIFTSLAFQWGPQIIHITTIHLTTSSFNFCRITNTFIAAAAAAESLQSCPTLCNPRDSSPPGSPIPRILQARTLEWVAISFSNAWKWKWSRLVVSDPQRPHGLQPTRLLRPWDFPGKSTGVGCHCLLLGFKSSMMSITLLCLSSCDMKSHKWKM